MLQISDNASLCFEKCALTDCLFYPIRQKSVSNRWPTWALSFFCLPALVVTVVGTATPSYPSYSASHTLSVFVWSFHHPFSTRGCDSWPEQLSMVRTMPWLGSQRSMGPMLRALVYDSSIGGLMPRRGLFFVAGGCLGWSRAERPSVSWTKMLETLCLQQLKEMLNIKCVQKHAKGHRYQQSPNTEKKAESQRAQRRGLRWNPKESTYARVGRCNQGRGLWWNPKEAPVPEPEVRVRDRKGQRFEQVIKVGGFFFCSTLLRCDLLAKKVPGRAPYSQHIIIRNWT